MREIIFVEQKMSDLSDEDRDKRFADKRDQVYKKYGITGKVPDEIYEKMTPGEQFLTVNMRHRKSSN